MELNLGTLPLKISLISNEMLKPHEEVIDAFVRKLAEDIRSQNEARDPLIVDQQSFVILDGMHRYASLKQLGCHFAPCCLLEYENPQIKVGSWYRFLEVNDAEEIVATVLDGLGVHYRKYRTSSQIHYERLIAAADRTCFELTQDTDDVSRAKLAVKIEKSMVKRGYDVQFASENTVSQDASDRPNIVIPLPTFTKMEIRQIVATGQLLPHKVTRHVIPSRPLRLDIPLSLLMGTQIKDANEKLETLLAAKRIDRRPPGSIVDGRQYQEELLVFSG